ncbi:MAG TPA: hypothetical protein VE075_04875 [Thermoanaerobaculia bacterium]|nr:hypothetical protein [Thermoanaerobaculia bacterium]
MSRVTCKQAVAVSALLATLLLMAPSPAQAAVWASGGKASWSSGLSWISALWDQVAALIHGGGPAAGAAGGGRRPGVRHNPAAGACSASPMDSSAINPDGQPHT